MSDNDEVLKAQLRNFPTELGLFPMDAFSKSSTTDILRQGVGRPDDPEIELLSLTRTEDGLLLWNTGIPTVRTTDGRRAGGYAPPPGKVIEHVAFEKIASNKVGILLDTLDEKLTPTRGLRRWDPATSSLQPFNGSEAAGKKVLLFIHGTFSNCDRLFADVTGCPNNAGTDLLNAAFASGKYDFVLTFDHPTVGVSPAMNAFDLAAALRPLPASVDVIAHSRGGLVARWFLEAFTGPTLHRRAVLVASTIAGTSLAAPPRLEAAIHFLANIGTLLGKGASAMPHPFLMVSGTLMRILSSVAKLGAAPGVLDSVVALIPGLQGQSRVGNNHELRRLRNYHQPGQIAYSAIRSDFQPTDPGWNFLQYFCKPMQRAEYWGAQLIFETTNDLVVDLDSMNELSDSEKLPNANVLDFGTNAVVHHTNYFVQERTYGFIRQQLQF